MEEDRERLRQILKQYSVRRGEEFVLASGRRSDTYVDARATTLRAEAMPLIGRLFLAKMREHGWNVNAVGGLTMGADPIVTAIARESLETDSTVNAFIVRKEAKQHGLQKRIEGISEGDTIEVVVVEDVATTGGSAVKALEACREAGLTVLGVIALVDREEGAEDAIEKQNKCPFDRVFKLQEL